MRVRSEIVWLCWFLVHQFKSEVRVQAKINTKTRDMMVLPHNSSVKKSQLLVLTELCCNIIISLVQYFFAWISIALNINFYTNLFNFKLLIVNSYHYIKYNSYIRVTAILEYIESVIPPSHNIASVCRIVHIAFCKCMLHFSK